MNQIEIEVEEFETTLDSNHPQIQFKTKFVTRPRDSGQYLQTDNVKEKKFQNNIKEEYQDKKDFLIMADDGCVYMKDAKLSVVGYTDKGVKMKCTSSSGDIPIWAQDKEELEKELI